MKRTPDPQKIVGFQCMREPLGMQEAIKESNRCLLCYEAPCSAGCPAGTDPVKFIRQIRFYNYKGAARTIRKNNILGGSCACICPVEKLCERACSLTALEDPVNISGLQRFAVDYGSSFPLEPIKKSRKNRGNVAIIGAGPAGMACASTLAGMDYDVTVFEKESRAGGVPLWNIPEFRLPAKVLEQDIQNLVDLGVTMIYNTEVTGKDAIISMLKQGFEAVFIGAGLSVPHALPLFAGFDNAVDYSSFLRRIKCDGPLDHLKNKKVVVIGGGSVAIDAAVTAKASGAAKVYLVSLEETCDLPADQEEISLARMMNVIFKPGCQITGVLTENTMITGVTGTEIEWLVPGKPVPSNARPVPGTEFRLNTDLVIQAIGTAPGAEFADPALGMPANQKGIDDTGENFETGIPGVFAGGDVTNGGATVVKAVGEGKKAAFIMDQYIQGRNGK